MEVWPFPTSRPSSFQLSPCESLQEVLGRADESVKPEPNLTQTSDISFPHRTGETQLLTEHTNPRQLWLCFSPLCKFHSVCHQVPLILTALSCPSANRNDNSFQSDGFRALLRRTNKKKSITGHHIKPQLFLFFLPFSLAIPNKPPKLSRQFSQYWFLNKPGEQNMTPLTWNCFCSSKLSCALPRCSEPADAPGRIGSLEGARPLSCTGHRGGTGHPPTLAYSAAAEFSAELWNHHCVRASSYESVQTESLRLKGMGAGAQLEEPFCS